MRLDELEERLGDAISVEWKAFLLRPEPKAPNQAKFVEYTKSWLRPAEAEPNANFTVWATDNAQPSSSIPAHVAAKAVAAVAPDAERSFHRRLLSAYFTENLTISDFAVLTGLANELGVNESDLLDYIRTNETQLTQTVIDEHNEAINLGINAVPTTLLGNVLPVPGAQEVDSYEMWIKRMIERQSNGD